MRQAKINVFQLDADADEPTRQPNCVNCIDLHFEDSICPLSVGLSDFSLLVSTPGPGGRITAVPGAEAFEETYYLSSAVPSFELSGELPANCFKPSAIPEHFDTVTLRLRAGVLDAVRAAVAARAEDDNAGITLILATTSSANSTDGVGEPGIALLEPIEVPGQLPPCFPFCGDEPTPTITIFRRRLTRAGFELSFIVREEEEDGLPPALASNALRSIDDDSSGLLRYGHCPASVCATPGPTRYLPPHSTPSGSFSELADPPDIFTPIVQTDDANLFGMGEVHGSGIFRFVGIDGVTDFNPRLDPEWTMIPETADSVWELGFHMENFEFATDETLTALGDPLRLFVPAVTQSYSGIAFDPGALLGGPPIDGPGPITVSLVRFDAEEYSVGGTGGTIPASGTVYVRPDGSTPVERVELGFSGAPDRPLLVTAIVDGASGSFAENIIPTVELAWVGELEVRAYGTDADGFEVFLGYDRVPVSIGGPSDSDFDGVVDSEDNCPDIYNPTQDAEACSVTLALDLDGDTLNDSDEILLGTSTGLSDTDGDGISDSSEGDSVDASYLGLRLSPTNEDADGDGLLDGEEDRDSNSDGVLDAFDPDNATIGIDPVDSLWLVEEEWSVTVTGDGIFDMVTGTEFFVELDVDFTHQYALSLGAGHRLIMRRSGSPA